MGGRHERKLPGQEQHESQRHLRGVCPPFVSAPQGAPCTPLAGRRQLVLRKEKLQLRAIAPKDIARALADDKNNVGQPFGKGPNLQPAIPIVLRGPGEKEVFGPCRGRTPEPGGKSIGPSATAAEVGSGKTLR